MSAATAAAATFRVAQAGDLSIVVRLLKELVEELGPPEMAKRVKPRLEADIRAALGSELVRIFMAEVEGAVVGLSRGDILTGDPIFRLRSDKRCGYVDQMYVRPSFRGAGIGRQLLHRCEEWFREQGIGHALLHAAPLAAPFYEREGYNPNREMFKRL